MKKNPVDARSIGILNAIVFYQKISGTMYAHTTLISFFCIFCICLLLWIFCLFSYLQGQSVRVQPQMGDGHVPGS